MLIDFWFGIKYLKQLVQCGTSRLHGVVQLRKLLHWVKQTGKQQRERNDRAKGDITAVNQPAANANDQRTCEHSTKFDKREVPGAYPHTVFMTVEQFAV